MLLFAQHQQDQRDSGRIETRKETTDGVGQRVALGGIDVQMVTPATSAGSER